LGLSTTGAGRIVKNQESGSRQRDDASVFSKKEPARSTTDERPIPMLAVREKNRRILAEAFIRENPVDRGTLPCPYPDMEKENRIRSIMDQPGTLQDYASPRSKCSYWKVKELAKILKKGDGNERKAAAEKLAMMVSDPDIYFIEVSLAALKLLVKKSNPRGPKEAKAALESLGIDLEKLTGSELKAIKKFPTGAWFHIKRQFSSRLVEITSDLEEKIKKGF